MNQSVLRSAAALLTTTWLTGTALAATVDQVNPPVFTLPQVNSHTPGYIAQQQVTVGRDGLLSQIDLYQDGSFAFQSFRFFINRGTGWQVDADDFSTAVTGATTSVTISIDLAAAGLRFSAGEHFMIGIAGLGPDATPGGLASGLAYAGGQLFDFTSAAALNETLAFTTYMATAPVPEPGAAWLLLPGLALVAAAARRLRPEGNLTTCSTLPTQAHG